MDISVVKKANQQYRPAYRAFNKKTGGMVYCYPKCSPKVSFILTPTGWGFYQADKPLVEEFCLVNDKNGILLRGTGICDRHGLEIYESDIIGNLTSVCSLGQGLEFMCAEVYHQDGMFYESYFHQPIYTYPYMEVCGNALENPDFLDEEIQYE